mmetsp:Transcript_31661/g.59541  ORF Transcript_31661/g.59541 Transcript_31661/m.59541 type:complete len:252 (-) Transcript_31661:341-1096(-)
MPVDYSKWDNLAVSSDEEDDSKQDPMGSWTEIPDTHPFDTSPIDFPTAWSQGLSLEQQHEWLCDCFRMRMDDMHCWGGGVLRSVMSPDATPESVTYEFLAFSKLAVKHKAVPTGWDWAAFLDKAFELVPFTLTKSEAKRKYGGENVFRAAMGGRSLRHTGMVIYDSDVMHPWSAAEKEVMDMVVGVFDDEDVDDDEDDDLDEEDDYVVDEVAAEQRTELACADVGGQVLWRAFLNRLRESHGDEMSAISWT